MTDAARFPFIFGAQYYRAPTPEPECWETDLARMEEMGFNAIKYWVQWRWSHRAPDRFEYGDLDRLMDLAALHKIGVTLNVIFDVAPLWLYERYPDAKQITNSGRIVEPYVVGHRQIGGHPGPCYNHPGALEERRRFMTETVDHFRGHPAMMMWDVWNEPEMCFPGRQPNLETLVCYCPICTTGFKKWLKSKYVSIEHLNEVWGRCYDSWDQVEVPRNRETVIDFVDWREFHLDTMAAEAKWRLDMVAEKDPAHGRYLHVVPNCWFSAVTCDDDFAMAEHCEVFAATMNGANPAACVHVVSAGRGKVCYNVESHINFGSTDLHPQEVTRAKLLADFLPQIGLGIKGFLFWQYRAEVLGLESPAWGLVNLDGTDRAATRSASDFWSTLQPILNELRTADTAPAEVAIWRSRKNEVFHFCMRGEVQTFNQSMDAWIDAVYRRNTPFRIINSDMLESGHLAGIKLLIMPLPYYVTQQEADALNAWVQDGGVLITEAHLAGYNATTGRHSRTLPGGGLARKWGLVESFSTASRHLPGDGSVILEGELAPDVAKALKDQGQQGGNYYTIRLNDGRLALGAKRYAELTGDGIVDLGAREERLPCLIAKSIGKGHVFYAGTHLAEATVEDSTALKYILDSAIEKAGLTASCANLSSDDLVHVDELLLDGRAKFLVIINRGGSEASITLRTPGGWRGLFTGTALIPDLDGTVVIPRDCADLFSGSEYRL